jgi:hypothetical protein
MNLFLDILVGLLGREIGPSQALYLHRTTQHTKTRTYIHASSGIRTHDPSVPAKTIRASDGTAIETSWVTNSFNSKILYSVVIYLIVSNY